MLLLLLACTGSAPSTDKPGESVADTAETADSADSGTDSGETDADTGETVDSGDTGETEETAETAETADTTPEDTALNTLIGPQSLASLPYRTMVSQTGPYGRFGRLGVALSSGGPAKVRITATGRQRS